jgi:AcrR family transcriptional regulator
MSLRQQNKAKSRARILEAARQLIAERGANATTTREIAKTAGISYQTLYNYFPNKALIIREILDEEVSLLTTDLEIIIKRYDGDLLATLAALNEASLALLEGVNKDLWRELGALMFRQEFEEAQLMSLLNVAHEHYYALLAMARGVGQLNDAVDLHLLAHTLFNLTDYAFLQYFLLPVEPAQFQMNLAQQIALLVQPYLTT